jgi:regulator of sigma E protease
MNPNSLTGLIFIAVFAGVILIHEFGHYIVSLLFKVEVEEFGIGLPPRAWKIWRKKGYFLLNDRRIEIPANFDRSHDWFKVQDQQCTVTADKVDEKDVLRTIEYTEVETKRPDPKVNPTQHIEVDEDDKAVQPAAQAEVTVQKRVKAGAERGESEFSGIVTELHPGTDFTLNWLPLGGFVRPKGENDPAVKGGLAAASPWARLGVLFAGPTMNLIAGILVFSFLFTQIGIPDFSKVQINSVLSDSPASLAGMQAGDQIVSIGAEIPTTTDQTRKIIYANLDQPLQFIVLRDGEKIELTATPLSNRKPDEGALGIQMGPVFVQPRNFFAAIPYGAMETYAQARMLVSLPAQLLRGTISPEEGRFIGLKGIYDLFGQAVNRDVESRAPVEATAPTPQPQTPSYYTLQLIAVLTVSIGLFNLFPFPALDGGRIIFVLPEIVLRRRVPAKFENYVHAIGMTILLLFMLYVNVMDFINPAQMTLP